MDTLISIVLIAIMTGSTAVLLIYNRRQLRQRQKPSARALLLLLPALLAAGFFLHHSGFLGDIGIGRSKIERAKDMETTLFCSQAAKVAGYLRDHRLLEAGLLVLVEDNPMYHERDSHFREALIAGGIPESKIVLDTVFPELEGSVKAMPTLFRMSASDFDKALQRHEDCRVVVSLVGIPQKGARSLSILKSKGDRKLIVLGSIPDPAVVQYGLANGSIAFAVTMNPDKVFTGDRLPSSPDEIFDLRYLMYTAANAGGMR